MTRVGRDLFSQLRTLRPWLTLPVLVAVTVWLTLEAAGSGVLRHDVTVAQQVQAADGVAKDIAWLGYLLGATPLVTLVATVIIFFLGRAGRHAEALFFLVVVLVRGANWLLKSMADSPRPDSTLVRVTERAEGLGFPSGHVMSAVLLYGSMIYLSRYIVRPRHARIVLVIAAASAMVITGFGRIYTGAHWPSDVLGGYLWGTLLLLLVLWFYRTRRLHRAERVPVRARRIGIQSRSRASAA